MRNSQKKSERLSRLIEEGWVRGVLDWKLYDYQREIYDIIRHTTNLKLVLNLSRRYGKSFCLCLYTVEECLRNDNFIVRLAAPTAKALRKIIRPILREISEDAPESCKPIYKASESVYYFPSTGSEIHISGCDGGSAENLRGQSSNLNIVDEGGFVDNLNSVVKSILIPQTLTTRGRTIIASTPPELAESDFFYMCQEAEAEGAYYKRTIYDNKSITKEILDEYAKEAGGVDSTTFKREYLCEFTTEKDRLIIPEWKDTYVQSPTINSDMHQYFHRYVALDIGFKHDFSCLQFGYYDFLEAKLVIQDEWFLKGPELTTQVLADVIKERELKLWGKVRPYRRISDNNNLILLNDLQRLQGISFIPTDKSTLHGMVNHCREFVKQGRLVIDPSCTYTLNCLKYGSWDKNRAEFSRSKVYGHWDAIASLVYLVRNLDLQSNPIPTQLGVSSSTHFVPPINKINKGIGSLFRKR